MASARLLTAYFDREYPVMYQKYLINIIELSHFSFCNMRPKKSFI